jgi:hypothetical protein
VSTGSVDEPAEGTDLGRCGRSAGETRLESVAIILRLGNEKRRCPIKETEIEGMLRTGRFHLDVVERFLVGEVTVPYSHGAFIDEIIDTSEKAIRSCFTLGKPHQRLCLLGKAVSCWKDRELSTEILRVPVEGVTEEHRSLVIEVVAGYQNVISTIKRSSIEEMAFRESARGTWSPASCSGSGGDVVAVLAGEIDSEKFQPA